jgi:hypothetical protein
MRLDPSPHSKCSASSNQLSLGVWLAVKRFKPSPITAGMAESEAPA